LLLVELFGSQEILKSIDYQVEGQIETEGFLVEQPFL
ncbi:MAG: hypothetical protein ACJAYA_000946, partial [Bacteroidia bacterium]